VVYEIYRALFEFFPNNSDYGLALAGAQVDGEKGVDALATVKMLRRLPAPLRDAANRAGFAVVALEARLALGEIEFAAYDHSAAVANLETVQRSASQAGMALLANKAAARLHQFDGHSPLVLYHLRWLDSTASIYATSWPALS
jgi:hypothetical protein